ncbi:LacI family DNA-binding transcriptional regulator [Labrys wisconsinensis]|uniref:DNA-binding LacI/PurR family transcriptional regulator n=1 Tax=Labrys wisconsinensis TaxID=425677 RepID=A0ABU0JKX7_9HYPH|nr:LacI family DNA-binding transcriptional regulator [Labrys wisconsinensis]MDQ0474939.1 DNA-binding LacI/PurR family transcriptional regulator [Labrys wisconsinensis]
MKPVSIRTVAERAGVSVATVSNVLNGKPTVAAALAERVRAVVAELGYVADSSASRLRSGKQALAGLVVPDLANPMFGAFVSIIEHLAREDGFDLIVVSSNDDPGEEAARLDAIQAWRPAGLIVIPCDGGLTARRPRQAHFPIVVADRIPDDGAYDLIAVNNAESAALVTRHIAAQGAASCLVAGSTLRITNIRERWDGVRLAAGAMAVSLIESGLRADTIRPRLRARLAAGPRPDALLTLDHGTTLVAYQVLGELGLAIPRDLLFASFDETEWMRLVTPAVTAVRQPVEAMAEAAWRRLMQRMKGDASPPDTLRLTCAIEIRGSTLRTPGRSAGADGPAVPAATRSPGTAA